MRNLQRTNSSPPPPTDGPDKTKELGAQVVKLTKILTSTRQALVRFKLVLKYIGNAKY